MALSKQALQKLLDNPGMFSAADAEVEDENIDDALSQKIQAPNIPEIDPEADLVAEAPQIADPDELNQEADLAQDEQVASLAPASKAGGEQYKLSPEVIQLMNQVKGNRASPVDAEVEQETIEDTTAPMDVRKKAMQQIRRKYLGQ